MPEDDLTLEGLVHDLRNVFEVISQSATLIGKDPKHAKAALKINRSVDQGARILSSILRQSQSSRELDSILDSAIEFAGEFIAAVKGPSLEFERQVEEGLRLRGNPAAWERVFVNLFLNAAQAISEGAGRMEIVAARTDAGVEITVSDSGPGIAPQNLPRIFEPGFTTRGKRSGLGLHIVRTLVGAEGGSIVAGNRSGGGAQFRILIPLRSAEEAAALAGE